MYRSYAGKRPAALRDRNRTAALSDFIEQREAPRLKLGYAHDLTLHDFTVTYPKWSSEQQAHAASRAHRCKLAFVIFEWDEGKASANARKHGVTFEQPQPFLLTPQL
ncbi:MAG: hypothetical protein ABSG41_25610 [Bryobacteraceae bacterium]|jgi:hypothetical protein